MALKYFVTGVAGFIGFHLACRLLADGHVVRGLDAVTEYYDPALKEARLAVLDQHPNFSWVRGRLEDPAAMAEALDGHDLDVWVHLAAQAGVRYSLENPESYISANLVGTQAILEAARARSPRHLMIASTSSVYGGNQKVPFSETDPAHFPVSLYAATKKSGEALSHSYAHLFDIPTTCFRFFTVYGPWGRPDMALFKFVERIERDEPIDVYGEGRMSRDFTYVDDLVEGIVDLASCVPESGKPVGPEGLDSLSPVAPWRVVNIAGGSPTGLMAFIEAVERVTGKVARKNMLPMQPGDVAMTMADPTLLRELVGAVPETSLEDGVRAFVEWYADYRRSR
ncbi:NAD-dependent epimerase/dehydratase family protein [Microbacterium thalassium]|uniref:UDP-glucuronate 4-epimerase n=1 Tax=Microbacterium thalassium TaxID=362649 RepID=A0A7X0FPP7_9MICO|nr:NAD-dependent epimerase/dehydratase family protein [Microbacterium thalassium]MBB6391304.1 UDP-glucuronate 4-epimerase [Microbacterium thalassium]GLK23584.1 NAD-dependent epimerase [Microbacterium thalassium]